MKIVQILRGPYEMEGMVWNLCLVSDDTGELWDEEIYYDSLAEAIADFEDVRSDGYIDFTEDEFWLEDVENGDDW